MESNEELKEFIAIELHELASQYIANRTAFLAGKRRNASGNLSNEMAFDIDKQARAEAVTLLLAFEEHGRYIDMKRLNAPDGGRDYVQAIEDWIRARGWEQRFIEKFRTMHNLRKVPPSVLTQIAWGIVKKRAIKVRPKRWYNASKTAWLADVFNTIAAKLPEKTSEILRRPLNEKK